MYDRIKTGAASLRDLHDIRSAIFKEFNLAKARLQTFSEQADDVAEQFRTILARPINQVNKQYLPLSKAYAERMKALKEFVKYTSYKGDLEKITSQSLRVGEIAQRVLGNAAARPQEVLDAIFSLADSAGGQLGKSVRDQIRFSDMLENFYNSTQTRTLSGGVARGVQSGVESLAEDVAKSGVIGTVVKRVTGLIGTTKKEQQRALKKFLESLESR